MRTVPAYAAPSAEASLEPITIQRRDLGEHDVLIEIAFAGICHSDIHAARGEWGAVDYPLVPGHEIAGTVAEVGSAVSRHGVGDRVGVGCLVDSCRECGPCQAGAEQYCENGAVGTYASIGRDGEPTAGGYSTHIVVDEAFVVRIPDALGLDVAAPLLCAGITLYSPLKHWNAGPGSRVAIIGLGGLGHMGVQIANALGADVTVLSQSLKKMEDGRRLGADAYYATSDPDTFTALRNSFDLIVNTVSATLDLDQFMSMLALDGTLVEVGLPSEPMTLQAGAVVQNRRSLAGSAIGGLPETQEMLDFCAEHGLAAEVEVITADQINEAYDRVVASDVRYRFVIDVSTLT